MYHRIIRRCLINTCNTFLIWQFALCTVHTDPNRELPSIGCCIHLIGHDLLPPEFVRRTNFLVQLSTCKPHSNSLCAVFGDVFEPINFSVPSSMEMRKRTSAKPS